MLLPKVFGIVEASHYVWMQITTTALVHHGVESWYWSTEPISVPQNIGHILHGSSERISPHRPL
jgi:hypothetical protein